MSSLVLQNHGSVHVLCGPLDAYAQLPRFQTTKLDGTPEAEEQTRQVRDVLEKADARNLSCTEVFERLEHAHGGQLRFTLTLVPAEPVASLDALVATPDWWRSVFVLSSWTKASIAALADLAPQCAVPAPRADAFSPDFPGFPVVATLSNDGVLVENTALNLAPCQVTSAGHGHLILFAMYAVRPLPEDVDKLLQVICNSDNAINNKKSEGAGKKAFKALGFAPSRTLTADQFANLEKVYAAVRDLDDKFNGKHVFARKFELVLHAAAVARHLGGPDTFVAAVRELIAANNPLLVGSKGVREVVAAMKRYVGEEGLSFADCFAEAVAKGRVANAKRGTVAKGARAAAAEAAAAEAAAATRKRKERDERTAARGGDGGGAAPARQRKKSKAAEKPGAASPPGQASSEEEMSEEEAPAGEPAAGVSTPARGAEEGATAAAPAPGGPARPAAAARVSTGAAFAPTPRKEAAAPARPAGTTAAQVTALRLAVERAESKLQDIETVCKRPAFAGNPLVRVVQKILHYADGKPDLEAEVAAALAEAARVPLSENRHPARFSPAPLPAASPRML
jgi:hypothetical protein